MLRFESIQNSSSSKHQILSVASQNYQDFISGSLHKYDEDADHSGEFLRNPSCLNDFPQKISLSNSLLECVD